MLGFAQSALITIASFLFVLTFVVTVHELGHFLAAKSLGVAVDRFSIGFGKAIFKRTDKAGVEWRLGWMPLGGYVKFKGDENAASVPDQNDLAAMREWIEYDEGKEALKRYFHFKPLWARAIVVAAGPIANFVLASALFALLLGVFGEPTMPPRVAMVEPASVAARAGFQPGDLVKEMDGREVRGFEEIAQYVQLRADKPIDFAIERNGRPLHIVATPARKTIDHPVAGKVQVGQLGIGWPANTEVRWVPYGPVEAVVEGVRQTGEVLSTTLFYLGRLIQGAFVSLLSLTAVLSVSIGFMNLLPIPVLDGGHLLFYAYEAVARRPLAGRIQAAGYRVGLALLLGFMLFATWNDLNRLRVFNFLGGLFS